MKLCCFLIVAILTSQLLSDVTATSMFVEDVEMYSAHCVVPVGIIRELLKNEGNALAASVRRKRSNGGSTCTTECVDNLLECGDGYEINGDCCSCNPGSIECAR